MADTTDSVPGEGHAPSTFQRRLPNALTIARVVMTVAFVAVLTLYQFPDRNPWALPTALVLFIVAAITDALDGHLARKWNVVSVFGRIVDPLADKVLILGAFIMLAGHSFYTPGLELPLDNPPPHFEQTSVSVPAGMMSGVLPWMVIVILARELLITTMRGALEGRGVDFSAIRIGKLKMIVQAIAVPLILLLVITAMTPAYKGGFQISYGFPFSPEQVSAINSGIAWFVTVVTLISGIPYVTRAVRAMAPRGDANG